MFHPPHSHNNTNLFTYNQPYFQMHVFLVGLLYSTILQVTFTFTWHKTRTILFSLSFTKFSMYLLCSGSRCKTFIAHSKPPILLLLHTILMIIIDNNISIFGISKYYLDWTRSHLYNIHTTTYTYIFKMHTKIQNHWTFNNVPLSKSMIITMMSQKCCEFQLMGYFAICNNKTHNLNCLFHFRIQIYTQRMEKNNSQYILVIYLCRSNFTEYDERVTTFKRKNLILKISNICA